MTNLENFLGRATPDLLEPQYVVTVVRHKGLIHWELSDQDNWILDWNKWQNEFKAAGHDVLEMAADGRSGIKVVNENTAEPFLNAPEVHKLDIAFLRKSLLDRFPNAESWWDVGYLFPVAFIDFDNKHVGAFYQSGPRLERYIPDGWTGEFVDFANAYPEEIFPTVEKFWIVDGKDLLAELNERGRAVEAARTKSGNQD
ncbi:hypothetical protein [Rhizobium bangladeshense]|uniref:hypothetical protein n=1 Tax=Rhizobium bangladeshense TaxID=1138189 RepID=UPI0007E53D7B|nr:hypothetical protein [Rhizobium bangladeshense]